MPTPPAGGIIKVSSVNGSKGAFGQTNYAAAKAGMHGFTKSLALGRRAKGVTVNTISPGYQNGDGHPPGTCSTARSCRRSQSRGSAKPEEVAGLIIYLCSQRGGLRHWRQPRHQRWGQHMQ